eukprot:TRINITY_DN2376_c0_g1_i2.p1 TRINITY_DN2376_c0_g1~~TRINITY_DN2376_c0_g1_i2.p1  ORF type:complete len:1255 (+),score=405.02 TRINITY_DN2376_c0_g1_i2:173-3766(+)
MATADEGGGSEPSRVSDTPLTEGGCSVPIRLVFLMFLLTTCTVGFTGFFITYVTSLHAMQRLAKSTVREMHDALRYQVLGFLQPFQQTVSALRVPLLSADFRDWRNTTVDQDNWRVHPPPWEAGQQAKMWEHPLEIRVALSAQEYVVRQWMEDQQYFSDDVLVYVGLPRGDIGGISVRYQDMSWSISSEHTNQYLVQWRRPRSADCWDTESKTCANEWRNPYEGPNVTGRTIIPLNATQRQWFSDALEAGKQTWCKPFYRRTAKDYAIPACMPVYHDDGTLKGIGCRDAPLSLLDRFLAKQVLGINEEYGDSATAFILEAATGLLISTSRPGLSIASAEDSCSRDPQPCRYQATRLGDANSSEVIGTTSRSILSKVGSWLQVPEATLTVDTSQGKSYAHVGRIRDNFNLDWVLVVVLDEDDMLREINDQTVYTVLICVALVLFSLTIDTTVVLMITRPLKKLSESMMQAAALELRKAADTGTPSVIRELRVMQWSSQVLVQQLSVYRGFLPQGMLVQEDWSPGNPLDFETAGLEDEEQRSEPEPRRRKENALEAALRIRRHGEPTNVLSVRSSTLAAVELTLPRGQLSEHTGLIHPFVEKVIEVSREFQGVTQSLCGTSAGLCVTTTWNAHSKVPSHQQKGALCAVRTSSVLQTVCKVPWWWCNVVSTGQVSVGNLGGSEFRSPFVHGAALLELHALASLSRVLSARCLISAAAAERVRGDVKCRLADTIKLVDAPEPINVYRLLAGDGFLDTSPYISGFSALRRGSNAEAARLFQAHLRDNAQDPDAKRLLAVALRRQEEGCGGGEYVRQQTFWQTWDCEETTATGVHAQAFADMTPAEVSETTDSPTNLREKITVAATVEGSGQLTGSIVGQDGRTFVRSARVLGKGAFAEVWLGMSTQGEMVAIKCLTVPHLQKADGNACAGEAALREFFGSADAGADSAASASETGRTLHPTQDNGGMAVGTWHSTRASTAVDALVTEITLMSSLRHDNVVGFHTSCVSDGFVYIVMEFVPGGNLARMLEEFGRKLPELSVQRYVRDIVTGLDFLHDARVVHQDLKPANVLVTIEGQCKLADFGASAELSHAAAERAGAVGTPFYMAPEAAQGIRVASSDIWSLGVTQHELFTGKLPWSESDLRCSPLQWIVELSNKSVAPTCVESTGGLGSYALAFTQACLKIDPEDRPTAHQLRMFPFVIQ